MAVLSSFFQMFLVFGMYTFDCNKKNNKIWLQFAFLAQCAWLGMNGLHCRRWRLWWCCDTILSAQMAVLSSFFQKFLVFEMYSFHCNKINNIWLKFVFLEQCAWLGMNCLRCRCWLLWWCCDTWCKMAVLSSFFQMFIVLRMYNFDCNKKITFDYSLYFWNSVHGWEWMAFVIVVGSNDAVTHDAAFSKWL